MIDKDIIAKAKIDIVKNIHRIPIDGEVKFIFKHGLLKDVAIKEQMKQENRKISYGKVTKTFQNDNVIDIIIEERTRIIK